MVESTYVIFLVSTQCIKYILRIRMVMFIYLSCDLRLVTYRPVASRLVAGCCSFCCRVTCDLRLVASCMSQVVVRFDVVRLIYFGIGVRVFGSILGWFLSSLDFLGPKHLDPIDTCKFSIWIQIESVLQLKYLYNIRNFWIRIGLTEKKPEIPKLHQNLF